MPSRATGTTICSDAAFAFARLLVEQRGAQRGGAGPQRAVDRGAVLSGQAHDVRDVAELDELDPLGETFEGAPGGLTGELRADELVPYEDEEP